ncbi:MAG TPA: hypothetical protein DER02_07000 [Gammaproteobacteria bacterium]|nr:hypothetical protein [Gammaproteobacteria bacterium]
MSSANSTRKAFSIWAAIMSVLRRSTAMATGHLEPALTNIGLGLMMKGKDSLICSGARPLIA